MIANKETTEKKCCFYVSDFHLEMTIVPYINRKIAQNKNIVIITQNKLEDTIKILMSKMNIKNKQKILELNWNNNELNLIEGKNNLVIIINGTKEFIDNTNKEIKNKFSNLSLELINCYNFNEIKDNIVEIEDSHTAVLNNLQKNY